MLRRRAILTTKTMPMVKAGDCISTNVRGTITDWLVVDVDITVEHERPTAKMSLCRPAEFTNSNPAARRTNTGRPSVVLANGKWRAQTHQRAVL